MIILKSSLFLQFAEIDFGFSTKIGLNRLAPFYFNTSMSVGDDVNIVEENRNALFNYFGLNKETVAIQKQEHTDIITRVEKAGFVGTSDAMITSHFNIGLVISAADCGNIYIYDKKQKVIAGIHSGWKGTYKQIVYKTVDVMKNEYNSKPQDLYVYLGPSISKENFEVKEDVEKLFELKYRIYKNKKIFIDLPSYNIDMLLSQNIPLKNIQQSNLCTYREQNLLHSYRRDGKVSGRAFGIIVLRKR